MIEQKSLAATDLDAMFRSVSNWGRWGPEDERGTLNLITPEKRRSAAALVRDGETVSCALSLPVMAAPDNPTPVRHLMTIAGDVAGSAGGLASSGDYFAISPHGMAVTHLDALCHIFVKGKMYNGFDQALVRSNGAERNSIMAGKDGIISRGVLLDIPAARGVAWIEPGDRITVADLEEAERRAGVTVSQGDILLVATGRDARREAHGPWSPREVGMAGLAAECVPWLHDRGVAVLASDGISDALPGLVPEWPMPVHQIGIVSMGLHLIDNAQLGRLAAACRDRSRWEFLFCIGPLRLERGTGSPINPVAVF